MVMVTANLWCIARAPVRRFWRCILCELIGRKPIFTGKDQGFQGLQWVGRSKNREKQLESLWLSERFWATMESDMHFILHVRVISCALIKIKFTHITPITRITFQLQWKLPMRHELGVLGLCHGDAGASLGTVRGSPGPDQEDLGCARYSHRGPFHGVGSKYVPMEKNRQIILNHPNFSSLFFHPYFHLGLPSCWRQLLFGVLEFWASRDALLAFSVVCLPRDSMLNS